MKSSDKEGRRSGQGAPPRAGAPPATTDQIRRRLAQSHRDRLQRGRSVSLARISLLAEDGPPDDGESP